MHRQLKNEPCYAPLFIQSLPVRIPNKMTEAECFLIRYPSPDLIDTTANKLRYYRYKNALLQREIADYAGIDRGTYINYESSDHQQYDLNRLSRIAELFEVDISCLLDDYNCFLYEGQGKCVKQIRKQLKLTQYEFGIKLGVSAGTIKRYESNKICMFKSTYEKLMKLL